MQKTKTNPRGKSNQGRKRTVLNIARKIGRQRIKGIKRRAWEGLCEEGGEHTWNDGFQACRAHRDGGLQTVKERQDRADADDGGSSSEHAEQQQGQQPSSLPETQREELQQRQEQQQQSEETLEQQWPDVRELGGPWIKRPE